MKKLILFALLLCPMAYAKVLKSIALLPPVGGYHLASVTDSVQLTPLCTYDDATTDNCSTQTLTWGSDNDPAMSVSSTGLVTMGPSYGDHITSISRSGGVITATTFGTFRIPLYSQVVIEGVADASFNGTYNIAYNSANSVSYNNAGSDATTSGGKVYFSGAYDVYVYSGAVLGHHPVNMDTYTVTSLNTRPEAHGSPAIASTNIVLGSTVIVSVEDGTYTPIDGTPLGDYVSWTSDAPSVASVDSIGNVKGLSVGSANITANYGGVTAVYPVTVINPTLANKTVYVRPDGGTIKDANVPGGQCDGTLNVPYAGSTGGHCALIHPMYLFTDETSSTAYTGALGAGDTAIIAPAPVGSPYLMGSKDVNTAWVTWPYQTVPSGTPSQPTRILGANYASCSSDSAKTQMKNYWSFGVFDLRGAQNVDIECIDISNWTDCNEALQNKISFTCPGNIATSPYTFKSQQAFTADTFSSNILLKNVYEHGFTNAWVGTPGPGLVFQDSKFLYNWQAGLDFDNPYGYSGNRTNGFTGEGMEASYNGCTEEVPKSVSTVARDGSGNLNVTFAAGQIVNYAPGTNLVLTGMTPSDLNGTFPVSAVSFNQETVSITGGSCINNIARNSALTECTFTTTTAPTFGQGSFVSISGVTPSWLNGNFEVFSSSSTGFIVFASSYPRPGWTAATISSGGTASTAISLTATATGSSESATTVGTASHVIPIHRCEDQDDDGYADGDGVGTGSNTIGEWYCDKCRIVDNMQDGWDMLHSAMVKSTFTNSYSAGNEGAAAKFGNTDVGIFYNNILIGTGGTALTPDANKPPDYNQYPALPYRYGDTFPVTERMWSKMTITNNTVMGGFNTTIDDICSDANGCDSLPSFENGIIQNNIFIGFQDVNNPVYNSSQPSVYCSAGCNNTPNNNIPWQWVNNIGFNIRNGPAGTGNNWALDPGVVKVIPDIFTFADESKSLSFDMNLTSTAAASGFSVINANVPTYDNAHHLRPSPAAAGALEYITNIIRNLFSGSSAISGSGSIN